MSPRQRGDTIVEVLIAIVVIASVLAGAYTSASRSLDTTTRNRERDAGVRLAQQQLELIKTALTSSSANIAALTDSYCLYFADLDGDGTDEINAASNSFGVVADPTTDIVAADYATECIQDIDGNRYDSATSDGNPFYVSMTATSDLYRVQVRWDRVGGGQTQVAELFYRVYP